MLTSLPPEYLASLRAQADCTESPTSSPEEDTSDIKNSSSDIKNSSAVFSKEESDDKITIPTTRSGRKRKLSSASLVDESCKEIKLSEASSSCGSNNDSSNKKLEKMEDDPVDDEYVCEEEEDIEDTLAEQEKHEGETNHEQEIAELQVIVNSNFICY